MANHYVREGAAGSADGSDWTNAWTDLPATLTRGDTYYIADGTYGAYAFDDAASGSLYIYIRKATTSDHGTETGWSSSYGDGQATFTSASAAVWDIRCPYLDFDGVVGSLYTGHGIRVYAQSTDEYQVAVTCGNGYTVNHIVSKHIEFQGPGWGTGAGRLWWSNSVTARDYFVWQYCYFHGANQAWLSCGANHTNSLIEYNWFEDFGSNNASYHSAGIIWGSGEAVTMNLIVRYNMFKNARGPSGLSTWIEPQGTGGNYLYFYGNVFWSTVDVESPLGIWWYTSADSGQHIYFYNNTIYGLQGSNGCGLGSNETLTDAVVCNNLWLNCEYAPAFSGGWSDVTNEKNTGASSLVNPTSGDFHLSGETAAGTDLGASFNIDPDGVTRGAGAGWDMGTYEYVDPARPYVRFYG